MKIIKNVKDLKKCREELAVHTASTAGNESIGFVPTMGALHKGHASLIEHSVKENKATIVSIFVNPTQFNDKKDFESYPDTLEKDLAICSDSKVDLVFYPKAEEMYPKGSSIMLDESRISKPYEGESRPGHFSGVLTVLLKLLNIVKPHHIYMGEKDYQQSLLTKKLCEEFFIDTNVRIINTVREKEGLPFSSRNLKLSKEGLKKAKVIAEKFHRSQSKAEFLEGLEVNLDYFGELEGKVLMAHRLEDIRILDNKDLTQ